MRLSLLWVAAASVGLLSFKSLWGFYGHQRINRIAVFTLPPAMFGFYKKNIEYLTNASVNPDRRRFSSPDEAPRHYLDVDHYGDSALFRMPRYWDDAVRQYSEDTLTSYGILPWHINRMYFQLRDAFMVGDPQRILRLSAELGHYVADAHVPLHTTENYNGQLTNQHGIHGLWESRLPELNAGGYDLFTGQAQFIDNVQLEAWKVVESSHYALDTVFFEERRLTERFGEKKYAFETKGKQTLKVYSKEFSNAYHRAMHGMVERRMSAAIRMTGSLWYTAWVNAGQPDLKKLINYKPSVEELKARNAELAEWKKKNVKARDHESD